MITKKNIHFPIHYLFYLLLVLISVFCAVKSIFLSADIDESYAVTLASRIAGGDRLFTDMWEIHQTSALPGAFLVRLFYAVTGSMDGVVIYLRIIGVFIQLGVSVFLYKTFHKLTSKHLAFVMAILYFNFTPKYIQAPEFSNLIYWFFTCLALCFIRFYLSANRNYLFPGGVFLAICVLAYPSCILLFPVYLVVLYFLTKLQNKEKSSLDKYLFFSGGAFLCAVLFFAYLLLTSGGGFVNYLSYLFMDKSHSQGFLITLTDSIRDFFTAICPTLLAIVICQIFLFIWKQRSGPTKFSHKPFLVLLLLFQTVYFFVQFHTIEKVNYIILMPLVLQVLILGIFFYIRSTKSTLVKAVFYSMLLPSLPLLFMTGLLSNLPITFNVGLVFPCVAAAFFIIYTVLSDNIADKGKTARFYRLALLVCIGCFTLLILASRVFLVRFTGTQRKNIFIEYQKTDAGPLAGIYLGEYDYQQYTAKYHALQTYVTKDDRFLFAGSDLFLYPAVFKQLATGNSISTPAFDSQLLSYYEIYPERIPSIIFVDREYISDYLPIVVAEPFGSWFYRHFDIDNPITDGPLYIYKTRVTPLPE